MYKTWKDDVCVLSQINGVFYVFVVVIALRLYILYDTNSFYFHVF